MAVTILRITDFRCFTEVTVEPDPHGLTVLRGPNGSGKTSVLEAVGWLATQQSLRGSPREVLIRAGADRAIVRADVVVGTRRLLVEAELPAVGSSRAQVNRQTVRRRADLAEAVRVSVFSPDDLRLVQGGPAGRRDYLDEVLVDRHPRFEKLVGEVDRTLRQRAAVLRQAGGRVDPDIDRTLDVWDERLAAAGSDLADAREALVVELAPLVGQAYAHLTDSSATVTLCYRRSWEGALSDALGRRRAEDLRRQVTSTGPHRDELDIGAPSGPARTHASQGEQRCVALALRLATHELRRRGVPEPPVLLLDDVFSELDARRAAALVEQLPAGQVLLTTAVDPPDVVSPDHVVDLVAGRLSAVVAGRP